MYLARLSNNSDLFDPISAYFCHKEPLSSCTNLTASVPREHIFIGTSHSDADISPCRLSVMDLCATDRLRSRGQNRIEE